MRSLTAGHAEGASEEPASSEEASQNDGALGAGDSVEIPEGEPAELQAGEGSKEEPKENKEEQEHPKAVRDFRERLAKEKQKREKLQGELSTARIELAKIRKLFDLAAAENERITEALKQAGAYDERSEVLRAREVQMEAKGLFEQVQREASEAAQKQLEAERIEDIKEQLRSEVSSACAEFPLASEPDVRAALRANPRAEIREIAKAIHEQRTALALKQKTAAAPAQQLPTTVAKPTGASRFEPELSRKGMAAALKAARAKG